MAAESNPSRDPELLQEYVRIKKLGLYEECDQPLELPEGLTGRLFCSAYRFMLTELGKTLPDEGRPAFEESARIIGEMNGYYRLPGAISGYIVLRAMKDMQEIRDPRVLFGTLDS